MDAEEGLMYREESKDEDLDASLNEETPQPWAENIGQHNKRYIQSVPACEGFPFGVEALRYPNGEVIPASDVERVVDLSEHGLKRLEEIRGYWENVARVALPRFNELERGERIHSSELSKRLNQVRQIGYEVPPYSRLSANEKWDLLMKIRADVRKKAKKYCPDILEQINQYNLRQKIDARGDLR